MYIAMVEVSLKHYHASMSPLGHCLPLPCCGLKLSTCLLTEGMVCVGFEDAAASPGSQLQAPRQRHDVLGRCSIKLRFGQAAEQKLRCLLAKQTLHATED